MSKEIIRLDNISKSFIVRRANYGLKNVFLHSWHYIQKNLRKEYYIALDNISLSVTAGESIGVFGHNGAGKTTLLEIISGIIRPDRGFIKVAGRIGMLLDLGTGFCPELSGRENILINGVMQGMSLGDMRALENDIIEFSGIEDFIDQPVFTYSSGMTARLGFSIAMSTRPDILLIDEILAVGDGEFRQQCLERVRYLQQQGTSLFIVSHNYNDIRSFCHRIIRMDKGRIVSDMPVETDYKKHYL